MKSPVTSLRMFLQGGMVPLAMAGGLLLAGVFTDQIFATPIPQNLGNGLRDIVEKQLSASQAAPTTPQTAQQPALINYDKLKITDAQKRILVNIVLKGTVPLSTVEGQITALGSNVVAKNPRYRAGVIEAFVSAEKAVEIAKMEGVSAVHLVPKPLTNIGKAITRGIVQHRIDKIPAGINGTGITVGILSDSYNLYLQYGAPVELQAAGDIASGDLPGPSNPFGHTQPAVILQEGPFGNDEGRAMFQIVHDIAPDARLGFATAFAGEVQFADNIRSLAGLPSGPLSRRNFKADVIIDDVIYFDEPMFQDGIIAQAVDDVAVAGVAYFSAAGNQPGSQAYDSALRLIPNSSAAVAGTNLDFAGVDPVLYKGGFHNFETGAAQDIAQTIHIDQDGVIIFQWNEPFDATPPTLGNVLQSGSGTLTSAMPTKTFPFAGTAGQHIGIIADAAPGSSNPLPYVTITVLDPGGNEIAFLDATAVPGTLISFLPVTGTYKIVIGGQGNTGDFVYDVRQASGEQLVETDFNLLFFDANGKFLGALDENNRATGRPIEIGGLFGTFDVQMVIARANKPPQGVRAADHLRYVWFFGGHPQEFVDYTTPATYGHNSAAGANGVGAYAFYPPFIPESFTSPGPVTIYFDKNNNPLPQPEVRLKPEMAAMDGADTTFFGADAPQDPKGRPNFFGTSAAAPHAGGIAALMLQAAGGRGSLAPTAVRQTLQSSAFSHDLDPNHAGGVAKNSRSSVSIFVDGDRGVTSSVDPNFFNVAYSGPRSVKSFTIDLSDANTTERPKQGLVFQPLDGPGFPFTLGNLSGVPASAITTEFSLGLPPAELSQFSQLTVSIKPGAMKSGDVLRFGVDRDEVDVFGPLGAVGGNSADLFGAGVLIPQGTIAAGGATFTATLSNGEVMEGTFANTIGHGYSPLDGYGFVNAQKAVEAVMSGTPAQLLNVSTRAGVQMGDNALIGGFIVTGESPKKVILRGIGPSLKANGRGVPGRLADPVIELRDGNGVLLVSNDNWRDSEQSGAIESSGVAPSDDRESAILRTLDPGAYTVILRGKDDTTGIGLVEVYDGNPAAKSTLANVSTRGLVETGDNAMIGGFMAGNSMTVVIRAIGPSLTGAGVTNALQDPTLELHDANGVLFAANDNWRDDPGASQIESQRLGPSDDRESATLQVLAPGAYTAVLRGKDDATGVALVEVYNVGNP